MLDAALLNLDEPTPLNSRLANRLTEYLNNFCTIYLNNILIYLENLFNYKEHVCKVGLLSRTQLIEV
jgi:hypothetical protein